MRQDQAYKILASACTARLNCANCDNPEWFKRHTDTIQQIMRDIMPSGSGVDNGRFDFEASKPDKLVFTCSFHHMDEGGYAGWSDHRIIITPSLVYGLLIRITGPNRDGIKDYLHDLYSDALTTEIAWVGGRYVDTRYIDPVAPREDAN